ELARAAKDGALDVVVRHVLVFRRENRCAQARIRVCIASSDARRNRDFSNDSGEHPAAFRVSGRFLMLNGGPFGMPGHDKSSFFLVTLPAPVASLTESSRRNCG